MAIVFGFIVTIPVPGQGARSSTIVSSVKASIVQQLVLFVAKVGSFRGRPLAAKSQLPTPVQSNRFLALLIGYHPSTIEFLQAGFGVGFRLKFEGSPQEF